MKRKLSALLALVLALGTTFGLTACGGDGPTANTKDDLEIFYWNSGQGRAWLDKTIEAFEAENPGVNVVKNFRETNDTWEKELQSENLNTIDLYINSMATVLAYRQYLEPLNDVMEYVDPETNTKIIDKFDKGLMDLLRVDDQLYATYWGGGVCGLVYNKTVFKDIYANYFHKDLVLPRTTDELATLAQQISEIKVDGVQKYTPFIFPGNADYWTYCYLPWAAQYGGMEEINKFWNPPATADSPVDKSVFTSDARKEALLAMGKLAAKSEYFYTASNGTDHTTVQSKFLAGTGLMMPNGNWLENEMRSENTKTEFEFMKMPIISALRNQLKDENVKTDSQLSQVVAYVDSVDYANSKNSANLTFTDNGGYTKSIVQKVKRETIDRVAEARNIVYTEGTSNKMAIPKSSNAKDWAKKFIQFMNTEKGLKFYWETLQGPMLAKISTQRDTSKWTPFAQKAMEMSQGTFVYRSKGHPFFYNNGLEFYPEDPQNYLFASTAKDRKTAQQFWDTVCLGTYNNVDKWNSWIQTSGLSK